MQVGLIGAGNMGSALARGWGAPVLATDSGSGRAAALVAELGGEAVTSNAELARARRPRRARAQARAARGGGRGGGAVRSVCCRCWAARPSRSCRPPTRTRGSRGWSPTLPSRLRRGVLVIPSETDRGRRGRRAARRRLGIVVRVAGGADGASRARSAASGRRTSRSSPRRGSTRPSSRACRRRPPAQLVQGTLAGAAELLRDAGHAGGAPRRHVAGRDDGARARRARARGPAPRVRRRDGRRRGVRHAMTRLRGLGASRSPTSSAPRSASTRWSSSPGSSRSWSSRSACRSPFSRRAQRGARLPARLLGALPADLPPPRACGSARST